MNLNRFVYTSICIILLCCSNLYSQSNNKQFNVTAYAKVSTDKSYYHPGDTVLFTTDSVLPANIKVRYRHLNSVIAETAITGKSWRWKTPVTDFTGYLVELYDTALSERPVYATVAVDVSSDWKRFPRYGFLSKYPVMTKENIDAVITRLNRYHINGLQFYDWQNKHHEPLAGTVTHPAAFWNDIANRRTSLATVKGYITAAHRHNMNTMFYNLAYGALKDAYADGVLNQWYLFTDSLHTYKEGFNLPAPPFKSDIYMTDPSNTKWQQYLVQKNRNVYAVLDFDGYHIDQLGNMNKPLYTYYGHSIDLNAAFLPFIKAMKKGSPAKKLLMNAVNQYGQKNSIAKSPVDFLYTEVWPPNNEFKDIGQIILDNDQFGNNKKPTVLAAYMNYGKADRPGYFNTHSVLFADAVIFAFGGAHLELGEHMLGKEYFPNDNLQMTNDLQKALVRYYDFMVAYENLLRDGGTFNSSTLKVASSSVQVTSWPPQQGTVTLLGRQFGNRQVLHLFNFTHVKTLQWRDSLGIQPNPSIYHNLKLQFIIKKNVKKIWYASPDIFFGSPSTLDFIQSGNAVSFTVPSLRYWDMIVIEYK